MTEKRKKKELTVLSAYSKVFASEAGKVVLHDLIDAGGIFRVSYVQDDSYGTAFNEGTRSLLLHVLAKLKLKPQDVEKFYDENATYTQEEYYE